VGSLLGALLGGYALFFWLDLDEVYRVALGALALAAVLVTRRTLGLGGAAAGAQLSIALTVLALLPGWPPQRLASGLFYQRTPGPLSFAGPERFFAGSGSRHFVFYEDGPSTSVAVTRAEDRGQVDLGLMTNGKSEGSVRADYRTPALIAILPALFSERAERAFVIGYGTGVTAGELARISTMREVTVAEISRSVLRAAPFLDEANGNVTRLPALRLVEGDAYRTLLRSDQTFDVIASEPSQTWALGTDMLYAREFLEGARDRLSPGGVFCQWMHAYSMDDAGISLVLRTYASVFPHVSVWYGLGADLLLLGFPDATRALDVERLAARAALPEFRAALERAEIRSFPELLAHELLPLDVARASLAPGDVQTLLHPRLGYLAARAFFRGEQAMLPPTGDLEGARVGRAHSLARRWAALLGGRVPERERAAFVIETCRERPPECATLLAAWTHEVADSPQREHVLSVIREGRDVSPAARAIPLGELPRLTALFDPSPPPARDGADPVAAARDATQLFTHYYHHGAPFPREHLAALWRSCDARPEWREGCRRGRAQAERRLGPLEPPPPSEEP
jgi:hypothetical protein